MRQLLNTLTCPHCKSNNIVSDSAEGENHWIYCDKCGLASPTMPSHQDALDFWRSIRFDHSFGDLLEKFEARDFALNQLREYLDKQKSVDKHWDDLVRRQNEALAELDRLKKERSSHGS